MPVGTGHENVIVIEEVQTGPVKEITHLSGSENNCSP